MGINTLRLSCPYTVTLDWRRSQEIKISPVICFLNRSSINERLILYFKNPKHPKKKYEEHQPILAFSEVAHRARPIADN